LARVDRAIGAFVDSLDARGIRDRLNLIILSDHGITDTPVDRMIYLDDYLDLSLVEIHDWNPVAAIDPRPGRDAEVYAKLKDADPHLSVYRRNEVPARFRFRAHPRITPIVAVAEEGWTITSRTRPPAVDLGNHGYDHELRSMAAFLIGIGPGFAPGARVESLQNVHLYHLMASLLGLRPAPNDGTLDSVWVLLRPRPSPPPSG
jgi:ectonucleotide pyrophosphatase/phosphodiesterase family protein 5